MENGGCDDSRQNIHEGYTAPGLTSQPDRKSPMPTRSGIALVNILPRVIAASVFHCSSRSHPVVDVHVLHRLAVSPGQHAAAGHLLPVRGEGTCLGVRLTRRAFERRLKAIIGHAARRGSIAADGMRLTVGRRLDCLDMPGLRGAVCAENSYRPFHMTIDS